MDKNAHGKDLPDPSASRRVATTLQTWVDRPELGEMINVSNYTFAGAPDSSRPPTLVISGPSGIGKTRLCLRYLELVSAETTSHPQGVQAQIKIEKADKITDLTVVPLSSIARRVLERLNISCPKDSELSTLQALQCIIPNDLKQFTREKPFKLVLYLDEIQNNGKGFIELKFAIQQLCDTHQNIRIQLVVSGIAAAFLAEEILEEPKLLELSSGPLNVVHVQHLTDEASSLMLEQALNEMCKTNAAEIVHTPYVKEALPWLGGNARMIEFAAHVLSSDDSNLDSETLLTQVKQLFSFKYPARVTDAKRNVEAYNCLIAACITQTPVAYKDVFKGPGADTDIHIKIFIKEGIAAFTPVPDSDKGYLSMPLLEMHIFAELSGDCKSTCTMYANPHNGQLIEVDHKPLTPLFEALQAHKFGTKTKKSTNEKEATKKKEEKESLEKKSAKKSNKSQKTFVAE